MTALVWATAIVLSIAVIMYGIYRIAKVSDDLLSDVHDSRRINDEHVATIRQQRDVIVDLRVEIDHLKNRKVHDADTE